MSDDVTEPFRRKVAESYEQGFIHPTIDISESVVNQFRRNIEEDEKTALIHKPLGISDEVILYDLDEDFDIRRKHLSVNLKVGEKFTGVKLSHPICLYCNNLVFIGEGGEYFCPVCD